MVDFGRILERDRAVKLLVDQFKHAFMPETNRERALVAMLEDAKQEVNKLREELHRLRKPAPMAESLDEW